MLLTLYDQHGNEKAELQANDSSTQDKEVQADNVLSLGFTLYEHVAIDVNDYVDFGGERYWAVEKYEPAEKSSVEWEYSLKLYGIESLIKRFLVLNNTDGDNEAVFTLTARPVDHVRLIVKCINDGMDQTTNFKVGSVEGTDNVVINYEGKYCDEALKELAEAVGVEWWFDGETVNLSRCEWGSAVVLGYGEGLTSLERDNADNVKFYTRLFPIGSSRNIDRERYGASRLQLPGGVKYVDMGDLVQKYGVIHHYEQEAFSGIYPRRVGVVSSVRSREVQDSDGQPYTIYYFKDNGLTFDPNAYEIGGLVKHVSFQEGSELAGLGTDNDHYFDVNYDSETQEFEIITIWPYDDDRQLPGDTLVPKPGDKYILWNIRMPDEYYTLAEAEYLSAVKEYNLKHTKDVSRYKGSTDHVWIEDTGTELAVGQRVRLESAEFFPELGYRESRITRICRSVNLPSQMDIEISDALSSGTLQEITDAISDAKSYAGSILGAMDAPALIRSWETTKPTDNNIYSARRTHKEFLSKQSDDIAQGVIGFVSGLWVKAKGLFGIDGEGNGRFNNIDFSGILSGLRAVINNIESGNYDGDGTSGSGWQLINDDGTGNSRLVVDNLYVRMKSVYNELEIRKMLHTAGNYIFSPAGSIIEQVDYYAGDELLGYEAVKVPWVLRLVPLSLRGKLLSRTRMRKVSTLSDDDKARVTKFRCWVVADDGTTRTINTWKVGMLARCETFNVAGGKDAHADDTDSGIISEVSEVSGKATGNKFYWREVTETGEGQKLYVDDGKVHNYVDLTNEDGFFFPGSDWPSAGDSIVCYGVTDESLAEYSNIVIIETVGADAPAIKEFQNVGLWGDGETQKGAVNWSLAGKMRTKISPRTGNKFYGEFLVWVKDGWQDMTTTFEIRLGEVRSEIRAVRDTNMLTGVIDGSGWVDFEDRLVKAGVTRDGGLYSASGKIISPFFDGGHELYYFSFYAKGEVTLKLNRYSDASDDRTADMVSSEVLHVSVADGDTYNGMQRYYTNAQVTEGFYCLLFEGTSADNAVYFPQAEEGQLTPFVVSGMETGSAITQSADRISLMVKSDLSKAGVVIEDDHVDLVGGKVNFVDAGGDAYIKVEKADNGINFVFMGRDADGNLIPMYNLGNTGLRQLVNNAVPDRWESAVFMCVGTKIKDAEDYSLRSINPEEKINPLLLCHPEDYDKEWFEGSWKQDPLVDTCIREMAVWRFHEGYTLDAQGRRIYNIGGSQGASEYDGRWCYDQSTDGAGAPVNFVNDNRGGWFFCGSDALWIDNGDALRTYGIEYKENKAEYVSAGKKVTEVWYTSKLTNERGEKVADGLVNNTGGTDLEGYTHVPFDGQGGREMVMPSAEE